VFFNSIQFGVFFLVVFTVYRALPRGGRNGLLLVASLVFYSLWLPSYLLLLLLDIGFNYFFLQRMVRSSSPRLWLALACSFTLGLLAYFKYAAMIVETLLPLLPRSAALHVELPDIFLPLGISFYSFQIIALTVDTYRREIEPIRSLSRYALYISFFPQLIAGPILRGHQFLPQLERGGECNRDRTRRGIWLIAVGLGKKLVMADLLLAPFVDQVFRINAPSVASFHWLAAYSFLFQVYFDFSGYCDIARGLALLLGFELPLNFSEPYLARSPTEFWRRWHITLSQWLMDYLYIPLGGNRRGEPRAYVNLMLTMLLGGLWHGANWTFVLWGAVHGTCLAAHRMIRRREHTDDAPLVWGDVPRIILTFHVSVLGVVFFRSQSLADAMKFFADMFHFGTSYAWPWVPTAVLAICVLLHYLERVIRLRLPAIRQRLDAVWWGAAAEGLAVGAVFALCLLSAGAGGDFIYFQF
jgi:alginate O-acetyltransferase complex protein AlgI